MKSIDTIVNENKESWWTYPTIEKMMKEYALEVLNEIVENPANYINDVDMNSVPYGVIDVKAIDTLRKRIQDGTV